MPKHPSVTGPLAPVCAVPQGAHEGAWAWVRKRHKAKLSVEPNDRLFKRNLVASDLWMSALCRGPRTPHAPASGQKFQSRTLSARLTGHSAV
jgi:hypothetical protein